MTEHADHELVIFVNRKKKTTADGVTPEMTVDAIARLVGLTADTATVQLEQGGKVGAPLSGTINIKNGEQFIVTRKTVEGGDDRGSQETH